jgi:hypothetical protein
VLSLTAVQRMHSKLSRLPEFRELSSESRRRILHLVCNGEIPQHDSAILSAIEAASDSERKIRNEES